MIILINDHYQLADTSGPAQAMCATATVTVRSRFARAAPRSAGARCAAATLNTQDSRILYRFSTVVFISRRYKTATDAREQTASCTSPSSARKGVQRFNRQHLASE